MIFIFKVLNKMFSLLSWYKRNNIDITIAVYYNVRRANLLTDVILWKKDRNTQGEINSGRQEGNVAPDGPQYANAKANSVPVQESNVDGYSAPIEYEDVGQFGSNTGEYNQLDPGTIGVRQQHYSALSTRPNDNNNAASAGVYEEIRWSGRTENWTELNWIELGGFRVVNTRFSLHSALTCSAPEFTSVQRSSAINTPGHCPTVTRLKLVFTA